MKYRKGIDGSVQSRNERGRGLADDDGRVTIHMEDSTQRVMYAENILKPPDGGCYPQYGVQNIVNIVGKPKNQFLTDLQRMQGGPSGKLVD